MLYTFNPYYTYGGYPAVITAKTIEKKSVLASIIGASRITMQFMENFAFRQLTEQISITDNLFHWRSKLKAEVDFVVQQGLEPTPIEVKAMSLIKKPTLTRSFRSFLKKYQPKKGYVINLTLQKQEKIEKTDVLTIPFYQTTFKE